MPPDKAQVQQAVTVYRIMSAALLVLFAVLASSIVYTLWKLRRCRITWITAELVVLALILRLVLLQNRAANDPYFFTLIHGSDNYVLYARQTLAGNTQIAGSQYAPGNTIWLAAITKLIGPHLYKLYIVNAIFGALSVIPAVWAGRLLANKAAGIVAGLLIATFPPLIFYHTTLQIASINASLMTWTAFLAIWMLQKPSLAKAVAWGVLLGVLTLIRPTSVFIGPALALAWIMRTAPLKTRIRQGVKFVGAAAVCALLVILAQYMLNRSVGSDALISEGLGPALLWGNNHVGDGSTNRGLEVWNLAVKRGQTYTDAALAEIRHYPGRLLELQLHKLGLFWSNRDIENNVQYTLQGLESSRLLNILALNGLWGTTGLLLLSLATFFTGYPRRPDMRTFLAATLILVTLSTVAFTVFGRMRSQIWPLLAIVSAVGIVNALQRREFVRMGVAFAAASLLLLVVHYFEVNLPRKQFLDDLPPDAIVREHIFNDNVRLLGFDPIETNRLRSGYVYLTLYWQTIADHSEDQSVYIHIADPLQGRINGTDHNIGQVTYPPVGTSNWSEGDILKESYFVAIPQEAPDVISVIVGVYQGDNTELLRIGMRESDALQEQDNSQPMMTFGSGIAMHNVMFSDEITSGEPITMQADWTTTEPIFEDYVWFVHITDDAGNIVGQQDDIILTETWTTSALIPGYMLHAEREIPFSEDIPVGTYHISTGLYRFPSIERLPAYDLNGSPLANNIADVGDVVVMPQSES